MEAEVQAEVQGELEITEPEFAETSEPPVDMADARTDFIMRKLADTLLIHVGKTQGKLYQFFGKDVCREDDLILTGKSGRKLKRPRLPLPDTEDTRVTACAIIEYMLMVDHSFIEEWSYAINAYADCAEKVEDFARMG